MFADIPWEHGFHLMPWEEKKKKKEKGKIGLVENKIGVVFWEYDMLSTHKFTLWYSEMTFVKQENNYLNCISMYSLESTLKKGGVNSRELIRGYFNGSHKRNIDLNQWNDVNSKEI